MSNEGVARVANLIWDATHKTWVREPSAQDVLQGVRISGITPIDGKLPVDTEISVSGDIIVEKINIKSAPLTEVYASGTFPVTDNDGSLTVDIPDGVGITYQEPIQISGVTITADGKIPVDTEITIAGVAVDSIVPVIISGTQDRLEVYGNVSLGHPIVVSGTQTVQAIDLDIRDLDYNQDSVSVSIGHPVIISGTQDALPITDNSGSLTIDGDLSIYSSPLTEVYPSGIYAQIIQSDDLVAKVQYNESNIFASHTTISGMTYTSATLGTTVTETFVSGTNFITITRNSL